MEHCLNSFSQDSFQNHSVETCKVYRHLDTSPALRSHRSLRSLARSRGLPFWSHLCTPSDPKKQIKINETIEKTSKQTTKNLVLNCFDGPQHRQDAQKHRQDFPRRRQDAAKTPQDAPRRLQDATRRLQKTSKTPQNTSKKPKDTSKTPKLPRQPNNQEMEWQEVEKWNLKRGGGYAAPLRVGFIYLFFIDVCIIRYVYM